MYQKQYQEALKTQVSSILDQMHVEEFKTVSEYLQKCYEDGFVGTMYDLHGQGIPLCFPLDQESMVRAVQLDSKISKGLYSRLGEDVSMLKKKITAQVSRGISTGMSFQQVAQQLSAYTNIGYNNAVRIARTEGHRIQVQSGMDACYKAKEKGADVVKQWDATLDGATRESHVAVDGEIRELDEKFSNGLMFPGDPSGGAAEVVNCRCALLQRARWALDDAELQTLKERAEYFGLDKADTFDDFKKNYLKAAENADKVELTKQAISTLDDCKTTEDVEKLFKEKNWYWETTIDGQHIRSIDGMSLEGIDFDSAKLVYQSQEKLFTKFPQLIGKLNGINAGKLAPSTYANCMIGLGHGGVSLNTKYFGEYAKLAKSFADDVKSGFHPLGVGAGSIVTHEFGHALDDLLTNVYHVAGIKNWKPKYASAYLRPKVMKSCGLKISDIGSSVSGYATKDAHEWFAECFCEYVESENPRPVAKEFGRQLEELMRGVDWNADA